MTYSRGSRDDFDRFANVTEDEGWSWNAIQPYIFKVSDKPVYNQLFDMIAVDYRTSNSFSQLTIIIVLVNITLRSMARLDH